MSSQLDLLPKRAASLCPRLRPLRSSGLMPGQAFGQLRLHLRRRLRSQPRRACFFPLHQLPHRGNLAARSQMSRCHLSAQPERP